MDRVWTARLRWRLRGAIQWPAFVVLCVVDALLLHEWPIAGDHIGFTGGLLLAVLFNLVVIAVAAPLAGRLVRRRRADLPALIASDYAGAAIMVLVCALLAGLGLAHRGSIEAKRAAYAEGMRRVRAFVAHSAPAQYRRHIAQATSLRFGETLYRTCVPGDDPRRALCLFVYTDQNPPGLRRDPNPAPNSTYFPAPRGT